MKYESLDKLQVGQKKVVHHISEDDLGLLIELYELGLVPGTEVYCVAKGPFSSPRAYSFRGATFALRSHEAEAVFCE